MTVSTNKLLVLEYFSDENSVNQLTKAIADTTPEQLERVKQVEAERLAAEEQAMADKAAKAAEAAARVFAVLLSNPSGLVGGLIRFTSAINIKGRCYE